MSKESTDFFNEEMAQAYDERNSKLAPIKDALLFSTSLLLKKLSNTSKVLCVGAGTGSEIIYLANTFPQWSFVALEPSKSMLDVCKKRVNDSGIGTRCEYVQGYVQDLPEGESFQAVLSLFVGHFVPRTERVTYFQNMIKRLHKGGYLVSAEISFDLESKEYPLMLDKWREVQTLMGGTPETLANLPTQLKEVLTVLPPSTTEEQIRQGGLSCPIRFFQALMICGWFGEK